MSAAAAATAEAGAPKTGKKKLIVIVAAVLMLALAGGGGVLVLQKKRAAEAAAAAEEDGEAAPKHKEAHKSDQPPTFLPLDPFVVNLADRESERYAQIGITLELDDPKVADRLKAYMPAIRNGILMVLAHKDSQQLLTREGKKKLAAEVMREAVRPLGVELEDEDEEEAESSKTDEHGSKKKKKKAKTSVDDSPVRRVHFSSFIVQ